MVYNDDMSETEMKLIKHARGGAGVVTTLVVTMIFAGLSVWLALTEDGDVTVWWVLAVLFAGISVYCVYRLSTPRRNKVFRKYKSLEDVAKMIDELLASEKIYEDKFLMVSNKYVMSTKDYTSIRKISDILAAFPYTQTYNFVPVAGGLRLIDKWGDSISVPSGISTAKARDVMEILAQHHPHIALGFNADTLAVIKNNKMKLPKE